MKKINSYFPLIILVLITALASFAIYKSNIKQNLGKENFSATKTTLFLDEDTKIRGLFDENDYLSQEKLVNSENKYTIINIFASWCATCIEEHEVLFEIAKIPAINFYGIAWNDYSENTKNYLQKYGNPYQKTVLDSKGNLNKILGVGAVPETFLVNPDGVIIYRHQGVIEKSDIAKLLNMRK